MNDNNEVIEPWNDESNLSMEDRRGTFLKVLCILSWIAIGLSLITNLFGFIGGKEKILENISVTEDRMAEMGADSNFLKIMTEISIQQMKLTYEFFNVYFIGNIIAGLIGCLGVYMMFALKKTGFFLYIAYSLIAIGIVFYMSGLNEATGAVILSAAFIIMYGVNLKRMTA